MKPDLSVVGIDSAKTIFHLVGMDERGKIILRKRLVRGEVISFMAQLPPVTGSSHGIRTRSPGVTAVLPSSALSYGLTHRDGKSRRASGLSGDE